MKKEKTKVEELRDIFTGVKEEKTIDELVTEYGVMIKDNVLYIVRPIPVEDFRLLKKKLNTKFDDILIGDSALVFWKNDKENEKD